MRRRDFVRGLLALGVGAAVADQLAFTERLGRVFASAGAGWRDDTAYIQGLIDEAARKGGGAIFLAPRTFHISAPVQIHGKNVALYGGDARFVLHNDGPIIHVSGFGHEVRNIRGEWATNPGWMHIG